MFGDACMFCGRPSSICRHEAICGSLHQHENKAVCDKKLDKETENKGLAVFLSLCTIDPWSRTDKDKR
jgi:hypothetical protein